jgi:hypothetical protein
MATDYATVEQFKEWVTLTDPVDDVVIINRLTSASRAIDQYCKTNFWNTAADTARVFDTCNTRWLHIDDAKAITEVATDKQSDGTYDTVWTAADYQLLPLNRDAAPEQLPITDINAVGTLTFPQVSKRYGLIRVTGTWGWPTVPAAVFEATLLVTNRLLKRRRSPEGVAGFDEFGSIRISKNEDPDAVRLLEPYRANRRQGGWAFA